MSNICAVCGKLLWNDGSLAAIDLCKGHSAPVSQSSFNISTTTDYALVLERIAIALEDISNKLGYLRSIAK